MLLLSRKKGEKIRIGENVILTVVAVQGNRVKIGFEAPRDISIARTELEKPSPDLPIKELPSLNSSFPSPSDERKTQVPISLEKTVVCTLE